MQDISNQLRLVSTTGPARRRAPSMYGGAGGFGTFISQSFCSSGPLISGGEISVVTSEKLTMQNLNDRLSSYLQQVHALEGSNRKLELQIREYYENKTSLVSSDFTHYFNTISELRAQISTKHTENRRTILQIDNAQMVAEDFRLKYETELNMRMMVEADVSRLRGIRDSLTLAISDLELQIESLKEEIMLLKLNHEEELRELKLQQTGAVTVEVDNAESVDLTKVLQEVREQYETLVQKKKLEVERWFQSKVEAFQTQIVTHKTDVKTSHTELASVKRTYQDLEIKLQSIYTEIQCLKQNVQEIDGRYGAQLRQLQVTIGMMESELQQLRASIEVQRSEYNLLLDVKMRLELEIAEYRRLLEGEYEGKTTVVISKVVEEAEEHKPHVERRVRVIMEELVDGVIVSSTSDTRVEEIQ